MQVILTNSLRQIVLLLSFLLFFTFCVSQENEKEKVKLTDALQEIEGLFDIKFSYIEENVAGILIQKPILDEELPNILKKIENQTILLFEKLNNTYYSISQRTASTLCGIIVDSESKKPLFGATVQSLNTNDVTVSNKHGKFTLYNTKPDHFLKIRSIGYETFTISANELYKTPCTIIYLKQKTEILSEVVVHQYLTTGLNKQKDGNITINTKDFGILPGLTEPDVLQTIQALPGVESVNETVSNINVRGGTHDHNLLLWDNIKMYQSGHFFGLISAFNPYLTEKVSVIKNGTSSSYGDGISSTIDMQSFNYIKDNFYGGAGLNLISGDVFAHVPVTNNFALQLSVRRSMTDFLKTPTYNQFYNRVFQDSKITNIQNEEIEENVSRSEDFFFYDANLKLFYDINNKHLVRTNVIFMNNALEYAETLYNESGSETKISSLDQKNFAFGGTLKSFWNDKFSTRLTAYYTNYELEAINFALLTDQRLLVNNEILETGVKLNTNYRISDDVNLLNGYQFYEVGITNFEDVINPDFRRKIKNVIRNHALFSEVEYQSPSNDLFARVGIRLNYIEKFGRFLPEPRVILNKKISNNFHAEFLAEMKCQTTNQIIDLQRDFLGVEKRKWVLANDADLPVTQSNQMSLGFNYNLKDFYVGIEGFYKEVYGVTTSNQGFQNQDQFQRTSGNYKVKGLEFLINKKTSKYSTWLGYTLSKNDYSFEELNPRNFRNNVDVRHSLSFAGTYTLNKLKIALGINWRTGKPYTKPVKGNEVTITIGDNIINYETPNSSTLPPYFRADFSSSYKFSLGRKVTATAGIAILNLLNRKNTLDTYYRLKDSEGTEVQQVENVSLGITPNASFRVFF
ncbi:TonB-dependent receptor [Abyssalbus ytuae]|uniref:TonB-dependent receptor n=1 Tax=Abyssalbus ytuae TaxID=2926907 RepID=A0A9E7CTM3_9FLAO|nr:carboxypeptidase-like regulatory domain-containing protein [Abyssalbus ytuae]UOB16437.1 TonB-dependent receptor [Abyssalbus ytuae]